MDKNAKIYVAGHNGMVGSAIYRKFKNENFQNLIVKSRNELDLTNQSAVYDFFESNKPEAVIIAAAKVGGIIANSTYPVEFLYNNIMIQNNLINASKEFGVQKLIFLGSSCVYPKFSDQPIKEEYLLTGALEPTNEAYSIAKISGIKMCQSFHHQFGCNFYSLMPTNLYGENDYFNLRNSHVIPALLYKMHLAKLNNNEFVEIWGTGKPTREFLFVDDLANAVFFAFTNINANDVYSLGISQLNIGTGVEISISELAETIKEVVGYNGKLKYNTDNPDGMPKRLLDVSKIEKMGWKHTTNLKNGLEKTYQWFIDNINNLRV